MKYTEKVDRPRLAVGEEGRVGVEKPYFFNVQQAVAKSMDKNRFEPAVTWQKILFPTSSKTLTHTH